MIERGRVWAVIDIKRVYRDAAQAYCCQVTTNDDCTDLPRRRPRHDCYPLTRVTAFSRARRRSAAFGSTRPESLRRVVPHDSMIHGRLLAIRSYLLATKRLGRASQPSIFLVTLAHPLFMTVMKNFRPRDSARRRECSESDFTALSKAPSEL